MFNQEARTTCSSFELYFNPFRSKIICSIEIPSSKTNTFPSQTATRLEPIFTENFVIPSLINRYINLNQQNYKSFTQESIDTVKTGYVYKANAMVRYKSNYHTR